MMRAEQALISDLLRQHHIEDGEMGTLFLGQKDTRPLDRRLNVIAPVSFACVSGRIIGSAYPELCEPVFSHLETYRENPLGEESLAALDRLLRPYLAGWGYRPAVFPTRTARSLVLPEDYRPKREYILSGTEFLTEGAAETLKNRTSMKFADCVKRPAFVFAGDGEVPAIAAVNSATEKSLCQEIGVECAPGFRRRGLGLSCVCALAEYLFLRGENVLYQHYEGNKASGALAEKAGFVPVGGFFTYTSMR